MKSLSTLIWSAAALTAILSTVATASVDTSPRPGGIVPLKPGIYVAKRSTCEDPPNAAIRDYDRRTFSTSSTRACRARVVSRRGATYRIEQSCIGAGVGQAPPVDERFTVLIENPLSFRLLRGNMATEYRYCPSYLLPKGLSPRVR